MQDQREVIGWRRCLELLHREQRSDAMRQRSVNGIDCGSDAEYQHHWHLGNVVPCTNTHTRGRRTQNVTYICNINLHTVCFTSHVPDEPGLVDYQPCHYSKFRDAFETSTRVTTQTTSQLVQSFLQISRLHPAPNKLTDWCDNHGTILSVTTGRSAS